ncbi:uncharacterized protein BDZ99DRAFT_481699 [Mytilinidion resinicola]|uniref:Uncharacterized protein n=1 Tax=Mytilinidion resinicola TaxID=574789 RepID=A0A6A6Y4H0_9PEZI|nr:uncharacterized protein BDZ99DRAFT_481699 [Mytilinidion resinicola]KAF2803696.1 hypothetical protein BDZ99DRAFT_481699 [Mytilinidion resinicola]
MSISTQMQNVNVRLCVYLLPIPIAVFYCICILPSEKMTCQSTSGKMVDTLLKSIAENSDAIVADPMGLVSLALNIQSKIILYLLAAAGVLFLNGMILTLLLKRQLKASTKDNAIALKRKKMLRSASLTTIWISVGLVLASSIAISQATGAMAFITQRDTVSTIRITAGKTLSVLQWLTFSFSLIFAVGISAIFQKQGGVIESAGSTGPPRPMAAVGGPPPPPPPPSYFA